MGSHSTPIDSQASGVDIFGICLTTDFEFDTEVYFQLRQQHRETPRKNMSSSKEQHDLLAEPLLEKPSNKSGFAPLIADTTERLCGCSDSLVTGIVVPVLLWLDFVLAQHPALSLAAVTVTVAMFVISSYLFRKTMQDLRVESLPLLLLPEIVMDVVLVLVLFDQVVVAFFFLLTSILVLATVVVVNSAYVLLTLETEALFSNDDAKDVEQASEPHETLLFEVQIV
jgi:hypothetical protein